MQSRICDLFILFNLLLADKSTKKRFPKFSLTNMIVFCKYEPILYLCIKTHPKKVGTETNKSEGYHERYNSWGYHVWKSGCKSASQSF